MLSLKRWMVCVCALLLGVTQLSAADVLKIHTLYPLTIADNATFLAAFIGVADDISATRNPSGVVSASGGALSVSRFFPDRVAPTAVSFDNFDPSSGQLTLSFAEPVNVVGLDFLLFGLRNSSSVASAAFRLADAVTTRYADESLQRVVVVLSSGDLARLQSSLALYTLKANTFLQLDAGVVGDFTGNPLTTPVVLHVMTFGTRRATQLVSFDLDMNTGECTLLFDALVDAPTANVAFFSLQSDRLLTAARAFFATRLSTAVGRVAFFLVATFLVVVFLVAIY